MENLVHFKLIQMQIYDTLTSSKIKNLKQQIEKTKQKMRMYFAVLPSLWLVIRYACMNW